MRTRRFSAEVLTGHKGCAVQVPFNPEELWGSRAAPLFPGRRGHPVRGSVNGHSFESAIVGRSGKHFLLLDAKTLYGAHVSIGGHVDVVVEPAARQDTEGVVVKASSRARRGARSSRNG